MKTITLEDAAWSKILEAVQRHSDEGPQSGGLQSDELEAARKDLETALADHEASEQCTELEALFERIRGLAGQIGRLGSPEWLDLPDVKEVRMSDAEEYCYQVRIGLATAAAYILENDLSQIAHFSDWCFRCCVDIELGEMFEDFVEEIERRVEEERDQG